MSFERSVGSDKMTRMTRSSWQKKWREKVMTSTPPDGCHGYESYSFVEEKVILFHHYYILYILCYSPECVSSHHRTLLDRLLIVLTVILYIESMLA